MDGARWMRRATELGGKLRDPWHGPAAAERYPRSVPDASLDSAENFLCNLRERGGVNQNLTAVKDVRSLNGSIIGETQVCNGPGLGSVSCGQRARSESKIRAHGEVNSG